MTPEEAVEFAKEVLSGHTRSHVAAASRFAEYILANDYRAMWVREVERFAAVADALGLEEADPEDVFDAIRDLKKSAGDMRGCIMVLADSYAVAVADAHLEKMDMAMRLRESLVFLSNLAGRTAGPPADQPA